MIRRALATAGAGLRHLSLRTRLLLMLLSMLVLSVVSLFNIHLYNERELLTQIRDYTDELSTTLEIAQEQPAAGAQSPTEALEAYAEKLRQLGVKDVTLADASEEVVQASTNPRIVGKRLVRRKGPTQYVVRGVLGEESGPPGTQRTSTLTIPIVVGDRRIGSLLVTRYLDDFELISQRGLFSRLAATLAVFALGILLALYLSVSFTRPLSDMAEAARRVADGDLSVQVAVRGSDELASLGTAFNEMVVRLRENKALEERLHFAERSTALGRLASAVAHEVRNPLNFINLSIDHVRSRLGPDDEARRAEFQRVLQSVKGEISRINRLVAEFLRFGKPMQLHVRECALDGLVRDVAALVEPKARAQGVATELHVEAGLPEVRVDPELLKTCLLNLTINALDAMGSGGQLDVSLAREGAHAVIAVRDTGSGMSAEQVAQAFEPYFSTKEAGLGLGLALTHKIVEDHGGRLTLESAPGHGTRARIALPIAGAAQASPTPMPAPPIERAS
ncbi:MAG: HAMP domain-containing protein [Vicinamibacteria bacterium]|nr:HAMP domain-containing protein [Vicinamibacteria bacterium]